MILFALLALILLIITIFMIVVIAVGGATFIVVFSDVIVCIAIIVWLLRYLTKRR